MSEPEDQPGRLARAWYGKTWTGISVVVLGAVALVVVLVLLLAVIPHGDGGRSGPQGAGHAAGSGHRAGADGEGQEGNAHPGGGQRQAGAAGRPKGCSTSDTDQTVPTSTPEHITWRLHQGTAYPTSRTAGPMLHDGPATYCYAHTPLGALLASVDITSRLHSTTYQAARTVAKHSFVPGKYEKQLLGIFRNPPSDSAGQQATSGGQLAGFTFLSYTPQVATIELVSKFSQQGGPVYKAFTETVRWYRGDWRLVIQRGPKLTSSSHEVPNLSQYVPFSGVG